MGRKRNDRGQFVETVSPVDVLRVLDEGDAPVVTAKEVSEQLGCSSEAARTKLLALRDRGLVARKRVGAGAVVWWLVDDQDRTEVECEIDPDDPLFAGDPLFASEDPLEERDLDDVLYDSIES